MSPYREPATATDLAARRWPRRSYVAGLWCAVVGHRWWALYVPVDPTYRWHEGRPSPARFCWRCRKVELGGLSMKEFLATLDRLGSWSARGQLTYEGRRPVVDNVKQSGGTPGSEEAREQGCVCPIVDNHHGKGRRGDPSSFYVNLNCPVHVMAMGDSLLRRGS